MDVHWRDERILITYFILSQLITTCTSIGICKTTSYLFSGECKTTEEWRGMRDFCLNCRDLTKYHCAKDFRQDDIYVEGCAEEKVCQAGEEPLLSFYKNQIRLQDPEVVCRKCEANRYNDIARNSSTYSQCPYEKKNICNGENHKKFCEEDGPESERICRCDARRNFYPREGGAMCSRSNYICDNELKCEDLPNGGKQERLLNYTCAPVCQAGFMRNEESDECVQDLTFTTELTKTTGTVATTSSTTSTTTTVPVRNTTSDTRDRTIKAATDNSDKDNLIVIKVGVPVALVALVIVIGIAFKIRKRIKEKEKKGNKPVELLPPSGTRPCYRRTQSEPAPTSYCNTASDGNDSTNKNTSSKQEKNEKPTVINIYKIKNIENQIKAKNAKQITVGRVSHSESNESMSEEEENPLINKLNIAENSSSSDVIADRSLHGSSVSGGFEMETEFHYNDEQDEKLPTLSHSTLSLKICTEKVERSIQKTSSDQHITKFTANQKMFDKDHVTKVYTGCYETLVDAMDPLSLLGCLLSKQVFTHNFCRDVREQPTTSERTRKLLQKLIESAPFYYKEFKECLKSTRQHKLLKEVEMQEKLNQKDKVNASTKECDNSLDTTFSRSSFKINLKKTAIEELKHIPSWETKQDKEFVAVKSTGNGNCLFNSICRFIKGKESLKVANYLRKEVANELSNKETAHKYGITHQHIQTVIASHNLTGDNQLLPHQMMITDKHDIKNLTFESLKEAIQNEGKKTMNNGYWCGMLQVMALANILNQDIVSLLPENTEWEYRDLYHGIIHPSIPNTSTSHYAEGIQEQIILLWTIDGSSNSEHTPSIIPNINHIVPVFSKSLLK